MRYQCKVCNIHSPSKGAWVKHLATKKHQSNVAELVEIVPDTEVMKALRDHNKALQEELDDLKLEISGVRICIEGWETYLKENGLAELIE
jgi:hypothetical protein